MDKVSHMLCIALYASVLENASWAGSKTRSELTSSAIIAHPTEVIKCKLQMQLIQAANVPKQFSGPIDVVRKTVQEQGVTGMWKGVGASFIYRTCFAAMFGGESGLSS